MIQKFTSLFPSDFKSVFVWQNWVKLDRQRLVDKSILMYKIVNRMVPDNLSSHFTFRSDTLTYNLRESDFSLAISQLRTNYCKKVYHTAELYCGMAYP